MLKHQLVTLIILLIVSATAAVMFMRWPSTFIPKKTTDISLSSQLPPASSLPRTEAVSQKINKILTLIRKSKPIWE